MSQCFFYLKKKITSWGMVIQDIQIIDIVIPKHIQDLLGKNLDFDYYI